jgi:uncharacterized protein YjbI with pentapeptide repeats
MPRPSWSLAPASAGGPCGVVSERRDTRRWVEREPVANDEHVALLRQGSLIWNEWRRRNRRERPDLGGADLGGADLRRADLRRASLRRSGFDRANLSRADLRKANLSEAHLRQADLSSANLHGANLRRSDLWRANLDGASLRRANLSGANLSGANLSEADLSGVNFEVADLSGADLSGADLQFADISGADLRGANLNNAYLIGTALRYLDLQETVGLENCTHLGPSDIGLETLLTSRNLPISFLRGCGLPDILIDYLPSLRSDPIQFYSCFISYSAKDQMFAERLHADLQNKGVRCWFAPHDLPTGAKTWDAIDEAIRLRDKLLLIFSKASIASEWVEDEVSTAYAEERSRKQVVLFPIRIDNAVISTAEPWAVKLRDGRNIGDFRQWKKPEAYQKGLERLLRDLKTPPAK